MARKQQSQDVIRVRRGLKSTKVKAEPRTELSMLEIISEQGTAVAHYGLANHMSTMPES